MFSLLSRKCIHLPCFRFFNMPAVTIRLKCLEAVAPVTPRSSVIWQAHSSSWTWRALRILSLFLSDTDFMRETVVFIVDFNFIFSQMTK